MFWFDDPKLLGYFLNTIPIGLGITGLALFLIAGKKTKTSIEIPSRYIIDEKTGKKFRNTGFDSERGLCFRIGETVILKRNAPANADFLHKGDKLVIIGYKKFGFPKWLQKMDQYREAGFAALVVTNPENFDLTTGYVLSHEYFDPCPEDQQYKIEGKLLELIMFYKLQEDTVEEDKS